MGSAGGITALGFLSFLAVNYKSYILVFVVLAVLMIIALGIFLFTVNEKKLVAQMHQEAIEYGIETKEEAENEENVKDKMPKDVMKSFVLILASIVFWFMGYNAATSKFAVYATDVLNTGYSKPLLVAQGAAIISYLPIGMLASKFGRKKTILLGIVELFTAFVLATVTTSETAFLMYVVMALAGIGWATINVNSYPMVVEMAKSGNVGKYTGIYYTASMSAQILTPILSGMLMDAVSMHALFPYCAVFCALAFVTMSFVKHGDAKAIPAGKSKQEIFEDTINALDD
jgi:MFS family permease